MESWQTGAICGVRAGDSGRALHGLRLGDRRFDAPPETPSTRSSLPARPRKQPRQMPLELSGLVSGSTRDRDRQHDARVTPDHVFGRTSPHSGH